jgi:hypothetical protein
MTAVEDAVAVDEAGGRVAGVDHRRRGGVQAHLHRPPAQLVAVADLEGQPHGLRAVAPRTAHVVVDGDIDERTHSIRLPANWATRYPTTSCRLTFPIIRKASVTAGAAAAQIRQ